MELDLDLAEEKCEHVIIIIIVSFLPRILLEKYIYMSKIQSKSPTA